MFTFKVHGNIDDELLLAAPAVGGGSSSASSAPAVGGTAPTTPPPKRPPPGLSPHVAAAEHQHQPLAVQQAAPAPAGGGTAPAQAAPAPAVGGAQTCTHACMHSNMQTEPYTCIYRKCMGVYVYLCAVSFKCRVVNFKCVPRGQFQVPREFQLARAQTYMQICIHAYTPSSSTRCP